MIKSGEPVPAQGAFLTGSGGCAFRVWAPQHESVSLKLTAPFERTVPMKRTAHGYHEVTVEDAGAGARYLYVLADGAERPDPASRSQPESVHEASEVIDSRFEWQHNDFVNPPLDRYVLYELHVGTFSAEGTFDGVVPYLRGLKELGVTAVELMPVAQFPGGRNWGYDGVFPYAAQSTYGGADGLRRLVDAAHAEGLAVVLDVVYNHLGPEGNYLADFGPYFSSQYSTPWGHPINFDGPGSDAVRRYFVDNALYWIEECRVDALRLDAIHAIFDSSARPFLRQLADEVQESAEATGRTVHLIAESALNDPRVLNTECGLAMDAHWNDDFHHALHVLLTGETGEYYVDYNGIDDLAAAINRGYVYTGQYSKFRNRSHGAEPSGIDPLQLVVFSQNHDQVGNRAAGDRLSTMVSFEELKLAAGITLLSPFTPLLFMGEEYGEEAPFPYFISHTDEALVQAVREGRSREFSEMLPGNVEVPDPQSESTFLSARLDRGLADDEKHRSLVELYRELLRLRRAHPALQGPQLDPAAAEVMNDRSILLMHRRSGGIHLIAAFNFGDSVESIESRAGSQDWSVVLDSSLQQWGGPSAGATLHRLNPRSFQVLEMTRETNA